MIKMKRYEDLYKANCVCMNGRILECTLVKLLVVYWILSASLGISNAAPLDLGKPEACNKQGNSFELMHVYSYDYTVKTASAFLGASSSVAGSMLTCTVTISVPGKCEHVMQVSGCMLSERNEGGEEMYADVSDANQFLQDLERYSVYFQMNKGDIAMGSIVADDRETLQVLNIKRGIVSALQFPVLDRNDYISQTTKTDIFGSCPIQYQLFEDDLSKVGSRRDISQCTLPNVHATQMNIWFGPSIGQMTGGVVEEPITEIMYPFETVVSCSHKLEDAQTLGAVNCLQNHYFKPPAYREDLLLTAMTNISQNLKLKYVEKKEMPNPLSALDGMSLKNIRFDFGVDFLPSSTLTHLQDGLSALTQTFMEARNSIGFETVPGKFGKLVQTFRSADKDSLLDLMKKVFDCREECTDKAKITAQVFFLDGLESCGTDACILTFLHCMNQDHTTRVQTSVFLYGLSNTATLSNSIVNELHKYCKHSDETLCWLTLGSILSKSSPDDVKEDSVLYQVLESLNVIFDNNCKSSSLHNGERKLKSVVKTAKNIGYTLGSVFLSKRSEFLDFSGKVETCMQNSMIPNSVKISILQFIEDVIELKQYRDLSQRTVDALFFSLRDITLDSTLRAFSFSILIKTTKKATIKALVKFMLKGDNTDQMKTYMTSAIRTLLEDDSPDLKEVKASWEAVRQESFHHARFHDINSYSYLSSKRVGSVYFFKLPVTEIFGGQVAADLIYDPSSRVFSTLRSSFNFYYNEKKYKLFECMVRIQGFDLLIDVLLRRINMTLQDMYVLYEQLKARAKGGTHTDEKFAKFQQNLVNAVNDLLQEVNHSFELEFDVSVDIAVKGKEVAFASLQELMTTVRQMKNTMPPNTSVFQAYLKKLLEKLSYTTYKSKEMINIMRDLPTCAGLPLNMTVSAYGTHILTSSIQSDLLLYIAGRSPTLSGSINPAVHFAHEVHGVLAVPIGLTHSTGMEGKILFGSETDVSLRLTYGYNDPMVLAENPTKTKLELELKPFTKDWDKDSQRVFYARERMQLYHNSGVEQVQRDLTLESSYRQCASDSWFTIIFRKLFCVNFVYPGVSTPSAYAYLPLLGQFDLDVTVEDLDSFDISMYKWTMEYMREREPGAGYTDHLYIAHNGIFGEQMSEQRFGFIKVLYVRDNYSITIDSGLPDFHYTYNAQYTNNWKRGVFDFTVTEILKRYGFAVTAFVFKLQNKYDGERREFMYHWNMTIPGLGFDIQIMTSAKGDYPSFTDRSAEISIAYYCTKDKPLLYMLHFIPNWAAENDDISKFYMKSSRNLVDGNNQKEAATGVLELYGRKLTADLTMGQDGPTTNAHAKLTYMVDGIEKKATVDLVWTYGKSEAGKTLSLSTDIKSEDFNVVATGSCAASHTDVTVSGDIQYQNTAEDNVFKREKRSMDGLYERLKVTEEAAFEKVAELKGKMLGESQTDMNLATNVDQNLMEQFQGQFQDADIPQYSIWDLKMWQAKVSLSAELKPVYAEGLKPNNALPEGIEATGTFTVKHPWNGGYVHLKENFSLGRNMRNTFRKFKFWFSGILYTTFTGLDGNPILDGDNPLVITRQGGVRVYRKAGEIFDYSFNYHGPNIDKNYSILFNWDAYDHNEPLIHVKSEEANLIMPYMNHYYEGKKNGMKCDTSALLKVLGKKWSVQFENRITDRRVDCAVSLGSMPDNTLIFSLKYEDSTSVLLDGAIKMDPEEDPISILSTRVALKGSSMVQVTQTWSLPYQEKAEFVLKQGLIRISMLLGAIADRLSANMDKPFQDQPFLFMSTTPRDVIKHALMPNYVRGIKLWSRIFGNLTPVKYNPDCPCQGSTIPFRLSILLQSITAAKNKEPSQMIRQIQFLSYLGIKAVSKLLFTVGTSSSYTQKMVDILEQRQCSYIFSTNPVVFERIVDMPELTEHGKHAAQLGEELFGFATRYNLDSSFLRQSSKSVAVIFGRHDSDRILSVQTFDGSFFHLSADKTKECSFLLASDLRQRRWSLVLSPAGVTLLTSSKTVTVGWNKNIYIDNCKRPSAENLIQSSDGKVTVKRKTSTIHVDTTFGLNLEFDTTYDICLVTVEGPYRNETIGLFGTNDKEKVTDYRLRDGHIASDVNTFLPEYVLTGRNTCTAQRIEVSTEQRDGCEEVEKQCSDLFQEHYISMYKCFNVGSNFEYNRYCKMTALKCKDNDSNFCPGFKAFKDMCIKKGMLDPPSSLLGICKSELRNWESLSAGSLDIVFVVSQHVRMTRKRDASIEYVLELALLDTWNQFNEIRLGVVLFGGTNAHQRTVRLNGNENNVFRARDDFDWEGLLEESEVTEGGTAKTDAFTAIKEATYFPFNPVAHKMIIVLMTKKQTFGHASDLSNVRAGLQAHGIILNVISTYGKTASQRIVGINWNSGVITSQSGYHGTKSLPENDYCKLIMATKGALWDLKSISERNVTKMTRMVEEFVAQTERDDHKFCQVA